MEKQLGWGILATGWIAELFTQDLISSGLKDRLRIVAPPTDGP